MNIVPVDEFIRNQPEDWLGTTMFRYSSLDDFMKSSMLTTIARNTLSSFTERICHYFPLCVPTCCFSSVSFNTSSGELNAMSVFFNCAIIYEDFLLYTGDYTCKIQYIIHVSLHIWHYTERSKLKLCLHANLIWII